MGVDTDAEVARLRDLLRDLVALSAIPAVWIERAATVREPGTEAVAAGLADALVRLLRLDFAFVRLCDPGGDGVAHATRGDAWKRFPQWLSAGARLTRQERIADVGDGQRPCPGVAIPIGVRGEAGLIAAACERAEFPSATDELLLSLAANQAATAFRSARLVDERGKAEQQLRQARNALEVTVAERTAELRRSEAYLAEAQRLTRTGSFAIDAATKAVTHSSDEHSRLYGFDPELGTPSLAAFLERMHPEDRARTAEALERAIVEATNVENEYRVVLPPSPVRQLRAIAHPVVTASGEVGEIVGTIIDITERREAEAELERYAGEQAALRRVATLVARDASQADVFTAIAEEIGRLFGSEESRMLRFEDDRIAVVVACSGELDGSFPIGARRPLGGENACSRVFRTGRPARIEDYGKASGPIAQAGRSLGLRCVVATPILVEGRLWGAMVAGTSRDERLPPETESRLGQFTELMATAIANTESRARANRLSDDQAALRRVATLVAHGVPPADIFTAVSEEVGRLFGTDLAAVARFDADGPAIVVVGAAPGLEGFAIGSRWELDDVTSLAQLYRTGRSARVDEVDWSAVSQPIGAAARRLGAASTVACRIVVQGRLWGAITVAAGERLPSDADERLQKFTDLVATALANADARAEVERLAEEQAALRRVATLVARGSSPTAVFDAVAAEMDALLDADGVTLGRYEPGDEITVVAHRGPDASRLPPGTRVDHAGETVSTAVRRTGRPARREHYPGTKGAIAEIAEALAVTSAVGAPLVVDGRLWGVGRRELDRRAAAPGRHRGAHAPVRRATRHRDRQRRQPRSAHRLARAAADRRRRRPPPCGARPARRRPAAARARDRDAQARAALAAQRRRGRRVARRRGARARRAKHHELRELARGMLPAALTRGGLRVGLDNVVARLGMPVQIDVPEQRLPADIEASAYFIVAEALTNVVKHASAARAGVTASVQRRGAPHRSPRRRNRRRRPRRPRPPRDARPRRRARGTAQDREPRRRRHARRRHAAAVGGLAPRPSGQRGLPAQGLEVRAQDRAELGGDRLGRPVLVRGEVLRQRRVSHEDHIGAANLEDLAGDAGRDHSAGTSRRGRWPPASGSPTRVA